ncbi:gp48 baseplate tail tube cap [Delftia phage PhiW-14]|uniref:Gp48 baseplate tail tube cap n=1 Tax=Delftia phage PhiW-14 TaxID=665032 RepID=C9DFX9_BPW14|nr:gp48 baseplate tail tube cap [Delftia phage PhiW-14]ACV50030.1 gp48 baseplate tail tube cap [Delftia phage PhiW-14]
MGSIGAAANLFGSDTDHAFSQVLQSVPRMVAGGVEAAGGPNIRSFTELATGAKQNAFAEVIFGSVNNRFFPFQWTLTPRNAEEAETIRQIVHRFRYAQMPDMLFGEKNGSFYRAPWTFDIHFVDITTGKESKWWPKIGTCALTAVSVNRTPNGEFSVIRSGDGTAEVPSSTVIDLQFTELFVLSKENMEDPNNSY